MVNFRKSFPNAKSILSVGRDELAGHLLEWLNSEARGHYHGEANYNQHQRNFLNAIMEKYKDNDATDAVFGAWKWLIDRDYLAEDPAQLNPGWYRLTARGREIKTHDQLQVPQVPRDLNPGPAPNFFAIAPGPLSKHLHVLWEEAVMCYDGNAHLSTVIMLGSLLEGALVAKCMSDPHAMVMAEASPKKAGIVKEFRWWSLNDFIEVATELKWVHKTRGDFSDTLREYRNMVHPANAAEMAYHIDKGTATICFQVVMESLKDLGFEIPAA